jgi:hypothetical protein
VSASLVIVSAEAECAQVFPVTKQKLDRVVVSECHLTTTPGLLCKVTHALWDDISIKNGNTDIPTHHAGQRELRQSRCHQGAMGSVASLPMAVTDRLRKDVFKALIVKIREQHVTSHAAVKLLQLAYRATVLSHRYLNISRPLNP